MNSKIKIIGKKRSKPLYKKFNKIYENVQSRQKLFKFKKRKWQPLLNRLNKRFFYRNKRSKMPVFLNSGNKTLPLSLYLGLPRFKKRYKYMMYVAKKINLFYGGLKKKYMRRIVKVICRQKKKKKYKNLALSSTNFYFLEFMEKRLESVLYRSFFTQSIKSARQLITHGYVFVNKQIVRRSSYLLKHNDLIEIKFKIHESIRAHIKKSKCWPTQQTNLLINYRTLQIRYTSVFFSSEIFLNLFLFPISIKNVIRYYRYI